MSAFSLEYLARLALVPTWAYRSGSPTLPDSVSITRLVGREVKEWVQIRPAMHP